MNPKHATVLNSGHGLMILISPSDCGMHNHTGKTRSALKQPHEQPRRAPQLGTTCVMSPCRKWTARSKPTDPKQSGSTRTSWTRGTRHPAQQRASDTRSLQATVSRWQGDSCPDGKVCRRQSEENARGR
eukprot:6463575-Amphidinium_carterae.4